MIFQFGLNHHKKNKRYQKAQHVMNVITWHLRQIRRLNHFICEPTSKSLDDMERESRHQPLAKVVQWSQLPHSQPTLTLKDSVYETGFTRQTTNQLHEHQATWKRQGAVFPECLSIRAWDWGSVQGVAETVVECSSGGWQPGMSKACVPRMRSRAGQATQSWSWCKVGKYRFGWRRRNIEGGGGNLQQE